ncbi:MAG: hypothetical protein ACI4GA_06145 [Acutalibacteraceae bacterium]
MKSKRITIRFNIEREIDKMAWEYLHSVPGQSINQTAINALYNHSIIGMLKDLIKDIPVAAPKEEVTIPDEKEQEETDMAVMDFLEGL